MIRISKHIVPKGFLGITLYPFIFLKREQLKNDKVLINHEKIHLQQQLELAVIFFYIFYILEWSIKLISYKNTRLTYQNISFEREAYQNENNLNYTKTRKLWTFLKYV